MSSTFVEPDWDAPLDVAAALQATPPGARIKGMYATAIVEAARARDVKLASARERYLAFQDVPMLEYIALLVEAGNTFFPSVSLRTSLRKLGRSSHNVFAQSVVGRVVLSTASDLPGALSACARAYAISLPPAQAELREVEGQRAVFALSGVYNFLDSHHIGVIEGIAHACGVRVAARVCMHTPHEGDIELTW